MPKRAGSGGATANRKKIKPVADIYTTMKAAAIDRFGPQRRRTSASNRGTYWAESCCKSVPERNGRS